MPSAFGGAFPALAVVASLSLFFPGANAVRRSSPGLRRGTNVAALGRDQAQVSNSPAKPKQASLIQLDLANLAISREEPELSAEEDPDAAQFIGYSGYLVNVTLADGKEMWCLNCEPSLFADWVANGSRQAEALAAHGRNSTNHSAEASPSEHGKHPNAPGYDEWERQSGSLASVNAGNKVVLLDATNDTNHSTSTTPPARQVTTTTLGYADMMRLKPAFQERWQQRRLVIGQGMNPIHRRMNFVEVLAHLARASPALTPPDCSDRAPHCGQLLSGLQPAASTAELRNELEETFGPSFLEENKFNQSLGEAALRSRVTALLKAMKMSFLFYRQMCLGDESFETDKCHNEAKSTFIGTIACKPEEDRVSDDCMYAEVRQCAGVSCSDRFFEYARFHGPMALLGTRKNRGWVMGQCEEFSRAALAMLSVLGYEARYVLDFTDHVWVEVRLPVNGISTWVHADPSEGVLDKPLMYEEGWGKKLTMIFAFTPWKVEHVTRTYTKKYNDTVWLRGVSDTELDMVIDEANERLKYELPRTEWGFTSSHHSVDRSLEEIALWSHFEAH